MCQVLLSIKPEYVEKIFKGTKRFEFRKVKFKRNDVNKIIIYSTSPVMKVVGEAEITGIIENTPSELWEQTKEYAGVDKKFFDEYFKNKEKAVAYKLGEIKKYKKPLQLKDLGIKNPPQSFIYVYMR
ncbi:Predicted transcriptional regulator, contains an HTH and PUA-like domains [Thermoanaerobacter thermohydrosulfuricus]|uniref:Predicted transcriptional regulator, contains an HTH and PUA-like domains n=2 Tax=Thermoanaerobacter TaxID=1754 RepID=A0A1G7IQQ2_THETY|nr:MULTISPECIES: ASCH domain-containing protein [Thermoanaerobacter]MDP9750336.1 putative transcriptional regulator [Thermoanaerobacter pentosaceus]UZQ81844.1 ASCH domain-containing protein [Thermoanaerobacter sp. RKWS2]SDF14991.1 Predicted transcriptional regulator, contains an HTH and PUA-like domains [Thermoanaerobacter thermohydrosulfuricus]